MNAETLVRTWREQAEGINDPVAERHMLANLIDREFAERDRKILNQREQLRSQNAALSRRKRGTSHQRERLANALARLARARQYVDAAAILVKDKGERKALTKALKGAKQSLG